MLTRKQHTLLTYICKFIREEGVAPSCEEMREAMGLKSKSGVHRLVTTLSERGYVRRLPHRARAMEVLRPPPGALANAAAPRLLRVISGGDSANGSTISSYIASPPIQRGRGLESAIESSFTAPVRGRIAAGAPLEAIQREDMGVVNVPRHIMGNTNNEVYALEVEGDSMIGAGILEGDMAILESTGQARDGDIVVALVDNAEATLKYFRLLQRGAVVALKAANPDYPTRTYATDRITIQGRLIGIVRKYS